MKQAAKICLCFLLFALTIAFSPMKTLAASNHTVINVSNGNELQNALDNATPGDIIQLQANTVYVTTNKFTITTDGNASQHIILQGPATAILQNESNQTGYVLYLNGADYWEFHGFSIQQAKKGIILEYANHNLIDNISILDIGEEAVHFRFNSTYNTIQNSHITNTGRLNPQYGEGVYVGSSATDTCSWITTNWPNDFPDQSDYNNILNNTIGPGVTAEAIDIKEGSSYGQIIGNIFDGSDLSNQNGADRWIDVKGNHYQIRNNTGTKAYANGFSVHIKMDGWGNHNVFQANNADVQNINIIDPDAGYGFYIQLSGTCGSTTGNIVYDDNIVINATRGISNIPTIPAPTKTATRTKTPSLTPTNSKTATRTKTNTPTATKTIKTTPTLTPTRTRTKTITPVTTSITLASIAIQDGWILESSENSNHGGKTTNTESVLRIGDDISNGQISTILSFNSSQLPDTAVITSATLMLKRQGMGGTLDPISTFQGFIVDIKLGVFGTSATLEPSDFQASETKKIGPFSPSLINGYYSLDITSLKPYINRLASNSGLTQIRLKFKVDDNNDLTANYLNIYSGKTTTTNYKPRLIIKYYVP